MNSTRALEALKSRDQHTFDEAAEICRGLGVVFDGFAQRSMANDGVVYSSETILAYCRSSSAVHHRMG
jgi:hypothetical protein